MKKYIGNITVFLFRTISSIVQPRKKALLPIPVKVIRLITPFLLITVFSGESLAQCTSNCTPMNEDFGSGTTCGSYAGANAYIRNQAMGPGGINPPGAIDDGEYVIVSCPTGNWNSGWATAAVDHTTGTGNFAMINSGAGPREIYHRNVPNLCSGATYQVSFWFANVGKYDAGQIPYNCSYGNQPSITTYHFPSGTTPSTCANATTGGCVPAGGTSLGTAIAPNCLTTTTLNWTQYTYTFTGQTAIDLVLVSNGGNNAGFDLVIDDIKVTWVSGGGVSCSSLPIDLSTFTAETALENIILRWSTAKEENFSHFIIEKSTDGINFEPIGSISGRGNSSHQIDYSYTDNSDVRGNAYYRLRQVDINGSFKYSAITNVNGADADPAFIYASDGDLIIQFAESGEADYSVVDMLGRTVYSSSRVSDESAVTINKNNFNNGVYIVNVQMGNEVVTKRIVLNY